MPFLSVPTGAWHDLLVALVSSDLLSAFSYESAKEISQRQGTADMATRFGAPGDTPLVRETAHAKVRALCSLYESRPPDGLRLTHWGRVRLSELKQALRSGREREPFGILWDVRHWEQDLQVAIVDAQEEYPLAVAYLDMNGLKEVNNTRSHDDGDLALKAYFNSVASAIGGRGEAYRLGGGADEVLAVLPGHDMRTAVSFIRLACTKLMAEVLWPQDPHPRLSVAAGIVVCTEETALPARLRSAAEQAQKRAKEKSRQGAPRPSVISIQGQESLIIIEHEN